MARAGASFDVETLATNIAIAGSATVKRFSVGARGAKSVDFLIVGTCVGAVPVLAFESRALNGLGTVAITGALGTAHNLINEPLFKAVFVAGDLPLGLVAGIEAIGGGTSFDTEHRIAAHEVIFKITTAATAGDNLTGVTVVAVLNF